MSLLFHFISLKLPVNRNAYEPRVDCEILLSIVSRFFFYFSPFYFQFERNSRFYFMRARIIKNWIIEKVSVVCLDSFCVVWPYKESKMYEITSFLLGIISDQERMQTLWYCTSGRCVRIVFFPLFCFLVIITSYSFK